VFATVAANHDDEARVPLARLGYRLAEGAGEAHLIVPQTTAVFDTGRPNNGFVHGGNSLQERVIPVLTVIHRAAAGGNTLQYRVFATAAEGVAGLHCVRVRVESMAQGALDFGGTKTVELALRVREANAITVELVQVRGAARLVASTVQASVGVDFEVFFRLSGEVDARVSVEVYHPSNVADVTPGVPEWRFAVSNLRATASGSKAEIRRARTEPETPAIVADSAGAAEQVRPLEPPLPAAGVQPHGPSAPAADATVADAPATGWLDQLPEGGVRQAFAHLANHGTLSEAEVIRMMGSPRGARQFANQVDELARVAPFSVRTDTSSGGKHYIREGGL
jgi:hypothetical protein